jgi:hypothetical protein
MYPINMCKTMALVGCAVLVLSLSNIAYADNGGSSGSGNGSSGNSGAGSGGSSGSSESSDSSSDDGGDDDGGGSNSGSGSTSGPNSGSTSSSGSQASTQNSGTSTGSSSGKVANQDEVLSAVTAGKAVSLPLLLAFMATKFPGEIVDIKLKNKGGLYSYEVEYLANSAKLRVVKLNAKTLSKL